MAWYLRVKGSPANEYALLLSPLNLGRGDAYEIEVDASMDVTNIPARYIGLNASSASPRFQYNGNGLFLAGGDRGSGVFNGLSTSAFDYTVRHKTRIAVAANGGVTLYQNDVLTGSLATIIGAFFADQLFNVGPNPLTKTGLNVYGIKIWKNGVLIHNYDPSASNGSGLTLIDTEGGNNARLTNSPTDNSQWQWYEDTPLNTGESRVGTGWAPSIREYSLLNDWKNAKKTEPTYQTALCRGYLGNPFFDIVAADFPAGALISGVVKYTGNNHDQLAHYARKFVINSTSQVIAENLKITHGSALQPTASVQNTGESIIRNSYILNTGEGGSNSASAVISGNGILQNCVIHGTQPVNNTVLKPSNSSKVLNCVSIGGFNNTSMAWPNVILDGSFILNGSNSDIIGSVPRTNTASSDNTGNYTGYTSAEFVDFENGDYRIKASSPLHALGIGAFFEDTGVTQPSTTYSFKVYSGGVFVPAIAKVRQSNAWTVATPRG